MNHHYQQSEVWAGLTSSQRRRLIAGLKDQDGVWRYFRLENRVTSAEIVEFARRNFLRGFFQRPAVVVTAVTARQTSSGLILGIALTPHPAGVALPAWGVSIPNAIRISFGIAVPLDNPGTNVEKKES